MFETRMPRCLAVGLGALEPETIAPPITSVVFDFRLRVDAAHYATVDVTRAATFKLGELALGQTAAGMSERRLLQRGKSLFYGGK